MMVHTLIYFRQIWRVVFDFLSVCFLIKSPHTLDTTFQNAFGSDPGGEYCQFHPIIKYICRGIWCFFYYLLQQLGVGCSFPLHIRHILAEGYLSIFFNRTVNRIILTLSIIIGHRYFQQQHSYYISGVSLCVCTLLLLP